MKVTIEFDSKEEAITAIQGDDWSYAMYKLDQNLRGIVKHGYFGNREATECEIECFTKCREMLREQINDLGLIFDI